MYTVYVHRSDGWMEGEALSRCSFHSIPFHSVLVGWLVGWWVGCCPAAAAQHTHSLTHSHTLQWKKKSWERESASLRFLLRFGTKAKGVPGFPSSPLSLLSLSLSLSLHQFQFHPIPKGERRLDSPLGPFGRAFLSAAPIGPVSPFLWTRGQ